MRRKEKYQQMKFAALILFAFLSASALAAGSVVVPSLPEAIRPLAEVETNVAFSVGASRDNLWRLSVELDASVSNCVEVVLGCDADEDGALGIDEGGLSVGWSCGEWFWRDRRGGGAGRIADGEGMRRSEGSTQPLPNLNSTTTQTLPNKAEGATKVPRSYRSCRRSRVMTVSWPYYTRVASAHTASGAMSISPGHESVPCDASTFSKNARSRNGS